MSDLITQDPLWLPTVIYVPVSNVSPYITIVQIFISFGIIGPIAVFENGVLLMYTLESVSGVVNLITDYEESE